MREHFQDYRPGARAGAIIAQANFKTEEAAERYVCKVLLNGESTLTIVAYSIQEVTLCVPKKKGSDPSPSGTRRSSGPRGAHRSCATWSHAIWNDEAMVEEACGRF